MIWYTLPFLQRKDIQIVFYYILFCICEWPWKCLVNPLAIQAPTSRARICKRLRSPGIDPKKSIPPAYVAWRSGTSKKGCRTGPPGWESIPRLLKRFTNTSSRLASHEGKIEEKTNVSVVLKWNIHRLAELLTDCSRRGEMFFLNLLVNRHNLHLQVN